MDVFNNSIQIQINKDSLSVHVYFSRPLNFGLIIAIFNELTIIKEFEFKVVFIKRTVNNAWNLEPNFLGFFLI